MSRSLYRLLLGALLGVVAVGPTVAYADKEIWYKVEFSGATVGIGKDRWVEKGEGVFYETHMEIGVQRLGTPLRMVIHTEEWADADGKLLRYRTETVMSETRMVTRGDYRGDAVHIEEESGGYVQTRTVPWESGAISQAKLDSLIVGVLRRGGTRVSARVFDPNGGRFQTMRFELVRADEHRGRPHVVVDQYIDDGQTPAGTFWYDTEGYEATRVEINQLGIEIIIERVDEEELASLELDPNFDIIRSSMIPCEGYPSDPATLDEVTFRLRFSGPSVAEATLRGPNQRVVRHTGKEIDVAVTRTTQPSDEPADLTVFLRSDRFIQSDHASVRALADSIAGATGTDGGGLARELQGWVNRYITQKGMGHGFASALDVLATREGDCTEHSVLLTALMRAAGIPARVAVGVAYSEGSLVGHMWSEGYIDGWRTFDALDLATNPVRIRVSGSTDERALNETALVDAYGLLGGLHVEVIEYRRSHR